MASSSAERGHDVAARMTGYFDPHLTLQMVVFLQRKNLYPKEVLEDLELRILQRTKIFAMLEKATGDDLTKELQQFQSQCQNMQQQLLPLLRILEQPAAFESLKKQGSYASMAATHEVTPDMIDGLYDYVNIIYQAGDYNKAREMLVSYRMIMKGLENDPENDMTSARNIGMNWGELACYILEGKWEQAANAAALLDDNLESNLELNKKELLYHRSWLAHWLLFCIFKCPEDKFDHPCVNRCIEIFTSEKYLALISLKFPYLLRYVAAAFILHNKKVKHMSKDLLHVLSQDRENYTDPLVEFLLALYNDMDFEKAKQQLSIAVDEVIKNDFFLEEKALSFQSNARQGIFYIYCRIHQSVNIETIAAKMGMSPGAAEEWIVGLIREEKLQARIDPEKHSVFFPKDEMDHYQQVMEKTKSMSYRLFMLQANAGTIVKKKNGTQVTALSPEIAEHLMVN